MPRESEGLTHQLGPRVTADENQMLRDVAAHMGLSLNKAVRWAIRYSWAHATSTTDHSSCTGTSTCAGATAGLTGGRQRTTPQEGKHDQLMITHQATVEES